MGLEGSHWIDMVGGFSLGVVFGIEHKHKSLWRRSPTGFCFFTKKHVPVFLGPVLGKIVKIQQYTNTKQNTSKMNAKTSCRMICHLG